MYSCSCLTAVMATASSLIISSSLFWWAGNKLIAINLWWLYQHACKYNASNLYKQQNKSLVQTEQNTYTCKSLQVINSGYINKNPYVQSIKDKYWNGLQLKMHNKQWELQINLSYDNNTTIGVISVKLSLGFNSSFMSSSVSETFSSMVTLFIHTQVQNQMLLDFSLKLNRC